MQLGPGGFWRLGLLGSCIFKRSFYVLMSLVFPFGKCLSRIILMQIYLFCHETPEILDSEFCFLGEVFL